MAMARAIATRCCWPARKLAGIVIGPFAETDPVEPFQGDGMRLALRQPLDLDEAEHDVLRGRSCAETG